MITSKNGKLTFNNNKVPVKTIHIEGIEGAGTIKLTGHGKESSNTIDHDFVLDDDAVEIGAAIDGVMSLILAHYSAGIDVMSDEYVEGIQVALEVIFNELG